MNVPGEFNRRGGKKKYYKSANSAGVGTLCFAGRAENRMIIQNLGR